MNGENTFHFTYIIPFAPVLGQTVAGLMNVMAISRQSSALL